MPTGRGPNGIEERGRVAAGGPFDPGRVPEGFFAERLAELAEGRRQGWGAGHPRGVGHLGCAQVDP